MKILSTRRKKWLVVSMAAVLVIVVLLAYALLTLPVQPLEKVIEAVTRDSLSRARGWSYDWPRITAVCRRYPWWEFRVSGGGQGDDSVITYGIINERTLEFSLSRTAFKGALLGHDSRAVLWPKLLPPFSLSPAEAEKRWRNLRLIMTGSGYEAEDDSAFYPPSPISVFLWHIGVKEGWTSATEPSIVIVIENITPFDGDLDFTADWSQGNDPPKGFYGGVVPMGQINVRTLKIRGFWTEM